MTTSAPSRAKASATPAPIPELLPVTGACFFSSFPISVPVLLRYVVTIAFRLAPAISGGGMTHGRPGSGSALRARTCQRIKKVSGGRRRPGGGVTRAIGFAAALKPPLLLPPLTPLQR
jgi:hypothetical protein